MHEAASESIIPTTPHGQVPAALICGRCPTQLWDPSGVLASPAVLLVVDRAPCVRRVSHSHSHWLLCFGHTALVFPTHVCTAAQRHTWTSVRAGSTDAQQIQELHTYMRSAGCLLVMPCCFSCLLDLLCSLPCLQSCKSFFSPFSFPTPFPTRSSPNAEPQASTSCRWLCPLVEPAM